MTFRDILKAISIEFVLDTYYSLQIKKIIRKAETNNHIKILRNIIFSSYFNKHVFVHAID